MGSACAQLTNHSVGRPMYYIDEASGGVLRERDSQVTGFHSSHSSRNLWSHWKWIEWYLACSGEGVGGWLTECSVVHEYQGDLLGREETGDGD